MHTILNVVLKNNQLHSLAVNDEMNLLRLISLLLDTNYQIKTKSATVAEHKKIAN